MNITELRIGNVVFSNGKAGIVTAIDSVGSVDIDVITNDPEIGERMLKDIENVDPAILNEHALIEFGFSNDGYKKGHIGKEFETGSWTFDFVLEEPMHLGEFNKDYTFELPEHRYINVKYIHQLQNLYFDVTGQELDVSKL